MDVFRRVFQVLIPLGLVICPFTLYGQKDSLFPPIPKGAQASIGSKYYTRLLETQAEYWEALKKGDSTELGELCYLLGKRYTAFGDYLTAKQWYMRSIRIREPKGYSEGLGKAYLMMGSNHEVANQFEEALFYARRGLVNSRKINSLRGLMGSYMSLSGAYDLGYRLNEKENKQLARVFSDSTVYYMHQAEKTVLAMKSPKELANVYAIIAARYLHRAKDAGRALRYANYALDGYTKQRDNHGIMCARLQLAQIYLYLKDGNKALFFIKGADRLAEEYAVAEFMQRRNIEEAYTDIYKQMGNWRQAFHHLEKMHEYDVSILSTDRDGAVARLSIEYETQKKELQLNAQKEELALRNRLITAVSVLLLVTLVMSIVFFWLFRKNRRISRLNADLVKEQNHRVKNNLQVVSSLLGLHQNRLADPASRLAIEESQLRVQAMAALHRKLYDGEKLVMVNLADYIPDLVDGVLLTYGFGSLKPSYTLALIWLHVEQSGPLGLILNELVMNACQYAFADNADPALAIFCSQTGQKITLVVSDNGPGIPARREKKTFGMWLIDVLSGQLKGDYEFQNNQGASFRLIFQPQ